MKKMLLICSVFLFLLSGCHPDSTDLNASSALDTSSVESKIDKESSLYEGLQTDTSSAESTNSGDTTLNEKMTIDMREAETIAFQKVGDNDSSNYFTCETVKIFDNTVYYQMREFNSDGQTETTLGRYYVNAYTGEFFDTDPPQTDTSSVESADSSEIKLNKNITIDTQEAETIAFDKVGYNDPRNLFVCNRVKIFDDTVYYLIREFNSSEIKRTTVGWFFVNTCTGEVFDAGPTIGELIPISSEESSLSSEEETSGEDFLFSPITVDELYGQRMRDVYEIDKNCVEELNKDLNACNAARGNIVYKYIQQWKAEMEYYYDILYGALNEEGKQQLQKSQEAWQTMYDTEMELNGTVQAMNNIMYDVFDDPYYTRYRERAITLYIKCMAMGNLSDAEGNRVYRILK